MYLKNFVGVYGSISLQLSANWTIRNVKNTPDVTVVKLAEELLEPALMHRIVISPKHHKFNNNLDQRHN